MQCKRWMAYFVSRQEQKAVHLLMSAVRKQRKMNAAAQLSSSLSLSLRALMGWSWPHWGQSPHTSIITHSRCPTHTRARGGSNYHQIDNMNPHSITLKLVLQSSLEVALHQRDIGSSALRRDNETLAKRCKDDAWWASQEVSIISERWITLWVWDTPLSLSPLKLKEKETILVW